MHRARARAAAMGAALRVARRGPSADVRAEAGSSSPSPEHKSEAWLAADRRRVLEEGRCAAPADAFDVLLTAEEVARHDRLDDAWVIVEGRVFDVTGERVAVAQLARQLGSPHS